MKLVERNLFPDWLIRMAICAIIEKNTRKRYQASREDQEAERLTLLERLRQSPIAVDADQANRQHYEVPARFFELVLGARKKYSCCYWPRNVNSLDEAEDAMLKLTCERAQLMDGMDILDLGCGWGSFSLWAAEHYPNSRIMAVYNSRTQKENIDAQCRQRNIPQWRPSPPM